MANPPGLTTASLEALPTLDTRADTTPGLVLIYSRLHAQLPAALAFAGDAVTLGRESDNTLAISEAAVSRYHARVERRAAHWWIVDNGSTNGVLVNGARIESRPLYDHDVVRIGDTVLRFAASQIYAYGAYRLDGTIVSAARPVKHGVKDPLLVGGFSVDALYERLEKVARTDISVVVTGESGTGKELVAREVHRLGGRRGAFQAINCASIPAHLVESELFGYRRGAFTGATGDKLGLVRAAHGGTLFLDEIGDMPLEAQAKLLRVLQEGEVLPLGATTPERVDVRVVCATHRDLDAHVADGRFRGDLLARLRGFSTRLLPLRERREDLYPLVRHFLGRFGRPELRVTLPFMLALAHHGWPYNVRELEAAVKLAIALADGAELDLPHLPDTVRAALDGHGKRASVGATAKLEPQAAPQEGRTPTEPELRALLQLHGGNVAAVGREFGKARQQVHRWMERYGIDVEEYRKGGTSE